MKRKFIFQTYQCPIGHEFQALVETSRLAEKQSCKETGCKELAEHSRIAKYREAMKATVIYRNAAGETLYVGNSEQPFGENPVPEGYERVEIPPHEIRKFEREVNREMKREHEREKEVESAVMEGAFSVLRESLQRDMKGMDTFHRELAQEALDQQQSGYSSNYDPEFRIRAYS